MLRKRGGNHQQTESGAIRQMGDLFEDYAAGLAWDEMFDPDGGLRPGYASLHGALAALGVDDLAERGALRDRSLRDQGITFSLSGEERPIPLDLLARVFPELFSSHRIRPVDDYPSVLLQALRAAAPVRPGEQGSGEPTIVVLTPGVHNSAYFEHSFLARQMGIELVEGRDLVCRDNTIRMRTTDGERRVDVIYRRTDDDFLDPLQFRHDSLLGCAGIVNAARAGNVAIANAVGNGVADDKAVYPYVPEMIRYYLGEQPILDTVPTFRLDHEDEREEALGRIGELVWKPVASSGGHGLVIGPQAEEATIDRLREAVVKDPRAFIAQEVFLL